MAEENHDWVTAGIKVRWPIWDTHMLRSMIAGILRWHGIEPAPDRNRKNNLDRVPEAALGTESIGGLLYH